MSDDESLKNQAMALTVSRIYFQNHLDDDAPAAYLAQRKINTNVCRKFEIGFAPGAWRGLTDHFSNATIRRAAKDAGLLMSQTNSNRLLDRFRGRLMFPIRNVSGDLIGYGGRILEPVPGAPKYINTEETALFKKGNELYGLFQHLGKIKQTRKAMLVEGYTDVLSTADEGFDYSVAPMGTALTREQLALLFSQGVRDLIVCLDGDSAGEQASLRTLELLMKEYNPALHIWIVRLPDQHDPDSFLKAHGKTEFQNQIDAAIGIPEFVDQMIKKDIQHPPCLEDKALYLHRLGQYTELCSGMLLEDLLKKGSDFSGLAIEQIASESVARRRSSEFSTWHRLVSHAARWMLFDDNPDQIAGRFSKIKATQHGLEELAKLANQLLKGEPHTTILHRFATAHGPLADAEFAELNRDWTTWYRPTMLEHHLSTVQKMPLDDQAKSAIKAMFSPR